MFTPHTQYGGSGSAVRLIWLLCTCVPASSRQITRDHTIHDQRRRAKRHVKRHDNVSFGSFHVQPN